MLARRFTGRLMRRLRDRDRIITDPTIDPSPSALSDRDGEG
jgi:hypothetical protein